MSQITFTLPFPPATVNSLYNVIFSQRRVELKPECRAWKSRAKGQVPHLDYESGCLFHIHCIFHYPFKHENGKLRKFDSHNMLKLLIDAVSEQMGFDDSRVKSGGWQSVDDGKKYVEVRVEVRSDDSCNL